jgi:hypothetical protein
VTRPTSRIPIGAGYCPWLMKMSRAPQVSVKINTIAKYSSMSPPSRGFDYGTIGVMTYLQGNATIVASSFGSIAPETAAA